MVRTIGEDVDSVDMLRGSGEGLRGFGLLFPLLTADWWVEPARWRRPGEDSTDVASGEPGMVERIVG